MSLKKVFKYLKKYLKHFIYCDKILTKVVIPSNNIFVEINQNNSYKMIFCKNL